MQYASLKQGDKRTRTKKKRWEFLRDINVTQLQAGCCCS